MQVFSGIGMQGKGKQQTGSVKFLNVQELDPNNISGECIFEAGTTEQLSGTSQFYLKEYAGAKFKNLNLTDEK